MGSPLEIILTIVVLSFWFIFPIGMFLSVSHVDKNTDQIIRLGHRRHDSVEEGDLELISDEVLDKKQRHRSRRKEPLFHQRKWARH